MHLVRSLAAMAACALVSGGLLVAIDRDDADPGWSAAKRQRYDAEMLRASGIAGTTVSCRTGPPIADADPSLVDPGGEFGYLAQTARTYSGGPTAAAALAAVTTGEFAKFPPGPYQRRTVARDRVLYTSAFEGRVRIALTVGRNPFGEGWLWLQAAQCDPADLASSMDSFNKVEVWTDPNGKRVSTREIVGEPRSRYLDECDGHGVSYLRLRPPEGGTYVSDPEHTFTGKAHGRYEASVRMADDAVDTGYRRAGVRLWRANDSSAVYLVGPDGTQRLPRLKGDLPFCRP